jgi:hypothetical protein
MHISKFRFLLSYEDERPLVRIVPTCDVYIKVTEGYWYTKSSSLFYFALFQCRNVVEPV